MGKVHTSLVLVPPVAHHTLLHTTMSPSFGLGLQLMSLLWLPPTGLVVCCVCVVVCMVCVCVCVAGCVWMKGNRNEMRSGEERSVEGKGP